MTCECSQSCLTLFNPWTVAHQTPLSMGFPKEEHWIGLPFPTPRDLPDPGIEYLVFLALTDRFIINVPPGKPKLDHRNVFIGKNTVCVEFSTINGFGHPLWVLEHIL